MAKGPNPPATPPGRSTTSSMAKRLRVHVRMPVCRPQRRWRAIFLVSVRSTFEAVFRAIHVLFAVSHSFHVRLQLFNPSPRAFATLAAACAPVQVRLPPLVSKHVASAAARFPLRPRLSREDIDVASIRGRDDLDPYWIRG